MTASPAGSASKTHNAALAEYNRLAALLYVAETLKSPDQLAITPWGVRVPLKMTYSLQSNQNSLTLD
jgi:hypothetical protein